MSFFDSLFGRKRNPKRGPSGDPGEVDSALREAVEAAIGADDGDALAAVLRDRQPEGKRLIRSYQKEMEGSEDREEQLRIARNITALVSVYERVFRDRQPLGWFQTPETVRMNDAMMRLREAQDAFGAADFDRADMLASRGLQALSGEELAGDGAAVHSTLLAVRGAIAVREQKLDDAAGHFEESLAKARDSARPETVTAALLNWIDLHTRRATHEQADDAIREALDAAPGTPYEDVLGKLLVERGVSLTGAGRLEDAVATFDDAVALKPDWPFPRYQRGWARFLSGDSGGALEDYRDTAKRAPVFFTVQREIRCLEDVAAGALPIETYRSYCLVRERVAQDPQEVLESAVRMLNQHPEFAPAYLLSAEALLALGNTDAGRDAARDALTHDPDPDTAAAALFLAWNLARRTKDAEGEREAAERLRTAYREHPAAIVIDRLAEMTDRTLALRWTFAMDGSLHWEEFDPAAITPPDQTPPSPGPSA